MVCVGRPTGAGRRRERFSSSMVLPVSHGSCQGPTSTLRRDASLGQNVLLHRAEGRVLAPQGKCRTCAVRAPLLQGTVPVALYLYCTVSVRTPFLLYMNCIFSAHSLYLYHTCTVPVLHLYRIFPVPLLYLYCTSTVPFLQCLYGSCNVSVGCCLGVRLTFHMLARRAALPLVPSHQFAGFEKALQCCSL